MPDIVLGVDEDDVIYAFEQIYNHSVGQVSTVIKEQAISKSLASRDGIFRW
jgi:hypothetical protein